MKRTIYVFGLISGTLIALSWVVWGLTMGGKDFKDFDKGMLIGFTGMILAFSLIFFAIESYRKNVGGGTVTFKQSFLIGLGITSISSVVYIIGWMIIYYTADTNIMEGYGQYTVEKMQAAGASQVEIDKAIVKNKEILKSYDNPLVLTAYTLLEIFPIGILVTLIAAFVARLRNKQVQPKFDSI